MSKCNPCYTHFFCNGFHCEAFLLDYCLYFHTCMILISCKYSGKI
nr:MAG TPA: hypothetical protein [Caudoviricetes sp.]